MGEPFLPDPISLIPDITLRFEACRYYFLVPLSELEARSSSLAVSKPKRFQRGGPDCGAGAIPPNGMGGDYVVCLPSHSPCRCRVPSISRLTSPGRFRLKTVAS